MKVKVYQTIQKFQMIQKGDRIIVGLSGGADSVALFHILTTMQAALGFDLCACHINHCLRGEESLRDEAFVRSLCNRSNVKCFFFTDNIAEIAKNSGDSIELAARNRRYEHFYKLSNSLQAKIATAHTLSDSIETFIFNAARGTGLRGLCGIPPVRGCIIRPFIEITRLEVEEYCKANSLYYITDSSNLSDDYTRNHIRHHIVPELYTIHSNLNTAFLRMNENIREALCYIEEKAALLLEESKTEIGFQISALLGAHPAVRHEAIIQLLSSCNIEASTKRLRLIDSLLPKTCGCIEIKKDLFIYNDSGLLKIKKRTHTNRTPIQPPQSIPFDGSIVQFMGKTIEFLCVDYKHFKLIENNDKIHLKNIVDYDKIENNAVLRTRKAGDQFSMPGRTWTKSVKKLFNEYKVPAEIREQLLVCSDDAGVFWIERFGVNKRVLPSEKTRKVLVIQTSEGAIE